MQAAASPLMDQTNQPDSRMQKSRKLGDEHKLLRTTLIATRARLGDTKKHLCENEDEVDNFHPNWFTLPNDCLISHEIQNHASNKATYMTLLRSMYEPLCSHVGIDTSDVTKTLAESENDLRTVFYRLEAEKLVSAFHDKYGVSFSVEDVAKEYRDARTEGLGRLEVLGNMYLGYFGDYEAAGDDDWSLDDASMMSKCVNAPRGD